MQKSGKKNFLEGGNIFYNVRYDYLSMYYR